MSLVTTYSPGFWTRVIEKLNEGLSGENITVVNKENIPESIMNGEDGWREEVDAAWTRIRDKARGEKRCRI